MTSVPTNISANFTNDKDLVELAGYHAYMQFDRDHELLVNDVEYRVLDNKDNNETGLNALTVINLTNKEISIVYVGTDPQETQDLITDAQLLSDLTPAQIEDARGYFSEMNQKYQKVGGVTSISGNSLAGALVGAVAIQHPEVKAVTLNPALLPEGMMEPTKNYDNITNYFSSYDVLTKTLSALDLHTRIPGHQHEIYNGIPEFSKLGTNHTGYLRVDGGVQYYQIGEEGQPGYGEIYIDADSHIVTSIWTGQPLYGGNTDYIEINKENLDLLALRLKDHVLERLELASGYLGKSVEIVEDEGSKLYERITRLQHIFEESFENLIGDPLFLGITSAGSRLKAEVDHLISLLNIAESHSSSLNSILNSPPADLVEHLFRVDISVESIFGEAQNQLNELKSGIDGLSDSLTHIVTEQIPELFKGGKDYWYDAVVGELRAHYGILNGNRDKLISHITEFKNQVTETASAFEGRDHSLGQSIKNQTSVSDNTSPVQQTNPYNLDESPYLAVRMQIKELQLDTAFGTFTGSSHALLIPILGGLHALTITIESTLEALSIAIKGATSVSLNNTLPGKLISLFTDFDDKITNYINDSLKPLDDMATTIEGIRKGLGRLMVEYPALLANFRPYVDSAIFNQSNFYNVQLYNLAAFSILKEMQMLFGDVVYQLGSHKAHAIEALCEVSEKVTLNMAILEEQVDRGTIN
ncbi:SA1320 family protein [Metabacillus herbersteinensis]|uniref:SA1320 family protein n=1 Tax=Metabacillus herbersteinensis TaxID=283816 RepID=A0ABV6GNV1_9BACI